MNLDFLKELGLSTLNSGTSTGATWGKQDEASQIITSLSPVDGKEIGQVYSTSPEAYENVVEAAEEAFKEWRTWPAPKRGEIVRQIGNALRDKKEALGKLVSYEMGKSYQEGLGEVQEMIDICDFAVGLSRQLYGLTMVSERPNHKLSENGIH